jgi:hypothetical protein
LAVYKRADAICSVNNGFLEKVVDETGLIDERVLKRQHLRLLCSNSFFSSAS